MEQAIPFTGRVADLLPREPQWSPPGQIYVPVRAEMQFVFDNGGDIVAQCFSPEMAQRMAEMINRDAGLS